LFGYSSLYSLEINSKSNGLELLLESKIFLDKTNSLTKNEVEKQPFIDIKEDTLGFGFVPDTAVWIEFTLTNTTNQSISKVLEYANPETEDIYFYDGEKVVLDGMWNMDKELRKSINPIFHINLKPHETKTYYIRAHSKITTLIVKLTLWNEIEFIRYDYQHKIFLMMFFASILTLIVYNFMLLIFTKDKAYFYYVIYLIGVMFFQSIYLGVAQLYVLSNDASEIITKATTAYISMLVIPIILFAREFLNTVKFPKLDKFLKFYLYLLPVLIVLSYDDIVLDQNVIVVFPPLGILLIFAGFYAYSKGIKQAKYYILGWSVLIVSLVLSVLEAMGFFELTSYGGKYLNEVAFALEALLFSIALAHRIQILNEEKEYATTQYIELQEKEKEILEEMVKDKTQDLKNSLEEKVLLYQELGHRVRNNMAMVLSLIGLQISKAQSKDVKSALETTQDRMKSIANLYDKLELEEKNMDTDTAAYFREIKANIEKHFEKDVKLRCEVDFNLDVNTLVYCGLILNELITNSYKYAFKENGEITVLLYKEGGKKMFVIADDGIGFQTKRENSLGLKIINTLVTKQLFGTVDIKSDSNGTKATIAWE
jgi:two-component sensor histidine kinase